MPYRVLIKNSAKSDIRKLKQSHLLNRFLEIVEALKEDPFRQSDQFKKLVPYHEGYYSRRINLQHRLVYRVLEDKKEVHIFSAWSHYQS